MNLSPREKDKLLISMAAMVARRRLERGVKLNHPEAVAIISDFIVEGARDGRTVAELMQSGAQVITRAQCMDGIAEMPSCPGLTRASTTFFLAAARTWMAGTSPAMTQQTL
jgi:urease subunit gamma